MNSNPRKNGCHDSELSFVELVVRYQDGTLTPEGQAALEAELTANPDRLQEFAELQMQSTMVHGLFQQQAFEPPRPATTNRLSRRLNLNAWGWPVATMLLLGWGLWLYSVEQRQFAEKATPQDNATASSHGVRLAGSSQATLFGELVPRNNALLELRRDYVLTGGLVELSFPTGASAIIESPAVFRILDREGLALDTGRCSVHAPDGAEGFRLETPFNRVVDRGTRFSVSVSENSETEVQVIEGLADVYRKSPEQLQPRVNVSVEPENKPIEELPLEVRLADREARRFVGAETNGTKTLPFAPGMYRRRLPDRVVGYEATTDARGGALSLLEVTVQRGGVPITYAADELIPVTLTWFKSFDAADPNGHLTGGAELPAHRGDWLSDRLLNTGVINPGGQQAPLTTDPVMQTPEDPLHPGTPGMAVQFASPVVNGPGPDVVFFELQSLTNPPGGDTFHVSPLVFRSDLQSMTVDMYDLTIASPEALPLGGFYLYRFDSPVDSPTILESLNCTRTHVRLGFRGLAVGIDLSELGYAEGEQVDGLFFQDADDDTHRVDPVFIGGLPGKTGPAGKQEN